jgi:triosephosphate isomerase (TIM)
MIAGNWKMNNTIPEATVLTQEIANHYEKEWKTIDVVLCPPYIDLKPAITVLQFDRVKVKVAAQNVYFEQSGAYTGEISVAMLKDIGCAYSIVGHSERRLLFGETDEMVNKKVKALVQGGLGAIVCVGESLFVRDSAQTNEYVCAQVSADFAGLEGEDVKKCVIAYEPLWAIGTGRSATPEQAEQVCLALRRQIAQQFGSEVAEEMRILYGGSMNAGNAHALLIQENIDGGLVGAASLKARDFVQLIKECLIINDPYKT